MIDKVGDGIGTQFVSRLRTEGPAGIAMMALRTNAGATQRMIDAGADRGASGRKLLLPLAQPHVTIVGISQKNVNDLIADAIRVLRSDSMISD